VLRNLKKAYDFACWMAWPTLVGAATAVDATETCWNTSGDRCTDRLRGS
jgi:hypothetical protein